MKAEIIMHNGNSFRFAAVLLLLLAFCTTGFSQTISESLFSLNKKKQQQPDQKMISLEKLIKKIESDQHIVFLYKTMWLKDKYVPANILEQDSLKFKLGAILQKKGLTYSKITSRSYAIRPQTDTGDKSGESIQVETVTGTVTDAQSGETLPGVNVLVKGTTTGTSTDDEGSFKLTVESLQDTLVFSFVGYQSQELPINGRTEIDVVMRRMTYSGDELVVIGYGTQEREDLTGSIATVSSERLQSAVPNNNFYQALQGAVPGVQISQNSSTAEGNNQTLLIRGQRSINASNSPLLIVDGVPYNGSISDIIPSNIENITVLKDASATAIYGSRAANGVVIIETKQGEGAPKISYEGSFGVQMPSNIPELLNGEEFYEFKTTREPGSITASEQEVYENNPQGVDWVDLALRSGQRQQHSLSVSGGDGNTSYYISGSVLAAKGISKGDKFNRFGTRANVQTSVTDWFTLGTNTQLLFTDGSGMAADFGSEDGAFYMNPLTTAFQENGEPTIYPWPGYVFWGNPLQPTLADNKDHTYKVLSNNFINIKFPFIQGLEYKLNTGVEYRHFDRNTYWGRNTKIGLEDLGNSSVSSSRGENYTIENIVKFQRDFGPHELDLTGLYSFQQTGGNSVAVDGEGFVSDHLTVYQNDQASLVDPGTGFSKDVLISQMLRANYGYDNRYLLTLTARRDGYSGFGDNTKYSVFPSAALAWNVSNEDFFNSETVNNLKLRFSWGMQGNQAVGPYETLALMWSTSYVYGGDTAPGYLPSQLANPVLGWETTTTTNIGLDMALWDDRLQFSVDAYNSDTDDLLLNRSIPRTHGHNSITQNIGETNNKGIEISFTSFNVEAANFIWNTQATVSRNWNKIVSLIGGGDIIGNRLFIGEPIDVNYRYIFDGVWQEDDDIANSHQPNAQPGYVKVKDVDGDGDIDPDDRAIQGQQRPKVIWGLQNTVSYKNFSLYFFIQGDHGSKRFQPLSRENVYSDVRRNTTPKNWWTPDNPTNEHWANDPDANPHGIQKLESDAFVRLKDISLSYTLGNNWLEETGMRNLKIYATARNVLTITNWSGLDPELGSQRSIPLTREFVFGLDIGF